MADTVPDRTNPKPNLNTGKPDKGKDGPSKQAARITERFLSFNPGGPPITPEFVQAALDQGLTPQEIRAIMRTEALGGPKTSADFTSPELVDYFTQNPGEIRSLYDAIAALKGVPKTYADYLAQGGAPGGYRSYNQLLQESVLGIGGARDAYLAGAGRAGVGLVEVPGFGLYDPASPTYQALARQGKAPAYDVTDEDAADYQAYLGELRANMNPQGTSGKEAGSSDVTYGPYGSFGSAADQMLASHFSREELLGEVE